MDKNQNKNGINNQGNEDNKLRKNVSQPKKKISILPVIALAVVMIAVGSIGLRINKDSKVQADAKTTTDYVQTRSNSSSGSGMDCSIDGYGAIMDSEGNFVNRDTFEADLDQFVKDGKISSDDKQSMLDFYDRMKEYCGASSTDSSSNDDKSSNDASSESGFSCH